MIAMEEEERMLILAPEDEGRHMMLQWRCDDTP